MNQEKESVMKYFFKKAICAIALLTGINAISQQTPMHTQYVMNKLFYNPAYAGYKEVPNITAVHRSQWLGFKGAPMTQVISFDTPLRKDELAAGATFAHDKAGPMSSLSFALDLAYRFRLSNRATFSFGAKATCELYQANITSLVLSSDYYGQVDEYFLYNIKNLWLPNVGFGAYYYKKNYYIGLSAPKMIRNKLERRGSEMYAIMNGRQEPVATLLGGYLFKINREIKVQPNFIAKAVWGAPASIGAHCNVLLHNQFNIGAFWYVSESAGLMAQWQVDKQLKIGYSMDMPTNELIGASFGSHELIVSYSFATRRKRIIYPRYF